MQPLRTCFVPLAVAMLMALLLSGCLSNRYKTVPKDSPPAPQMRLEGVSPELSVMVNSLIVFKGPGSWKKEAYWDEYLVTLSNHTDHPLTIKAAALLDATDLEELAGSDPWAIERRSREKLKQYERTGRKILLGAGLGAAWLGTGMVTAEIALAGGSATAVAAGGVAFIGLPILGVGTLVRTGFAKSEIRDKFQKRRLGLPVTLAPHETKSGSLFFAITAGPRRLVLQFVDADATKGVSLPLDSLAGLHFAPASGEPTSRRR